MVTYRQTDSEITGDDRRGLSRRLLLICGLVVVGIIVVLILLVSGRQKHNAKVDQLVQQQTQKPSSETFVTYNHVEDLGLSGLTLKQQAALKQVLYAQFKSAKTFSIDQKSIKRSPHNPNSDNTFDTLSFSLSIDNKSYTARLEYFSLVSIRLYLTDPGSGQVIYTSGDYSFKQ